MRTDRRQFFRQDSCAEERGQGWAFGEKWGSMKKLQGSFQVHKLVFGSGEQWNSWLTSISKYGGTRWANCRNDFQFWIMAGKKSWICEFQSPFWA